MVLVYVRRAALKMEGAEREERRLGVCILCNVAWGRNWGIIQSTRLNA